MAKKLHAAPYLVDPDPAVALSEKIQLLVPDEVITEELRHFMSGDTWALHLLLPGKGHREYIFVGVPFKVHGGTGVRRIFGIKHETPTGTHTAKAGEPNAGNGAHEVFVDRSMSIHMV